MQLELGWVKDKAKDLDLGIRPMIVPCIHIALQKLLGAFICLSEAWKWVSSFTEENGVPGSLPVGSI